MNIEKIISMIEVYGDRDIKPSNPLSYSNICWYLTNSNQKNIELAKKFDKIVWQEVSNIMRSKNKDLSNKELEEIRKKYFKECDRI
jgi:hypothetical protein